MGGALPLCGQEGAEGGTDGGAQRASPGACAVLIATGVGARPYSTYAQMSGTATLPGPYSFVLFESIPVAVQGELPDM